MHYIATRRGVHYHNHSVILPFSGRWEDYRSLDRVGKGKFSVVYRGRHRATGTHIAMKYLIYPVEDTRITVCDLLRIGCLKFMCGVYCRGKSS
jgi:hypothetical protein